MNKKIEVVIGGVETVFLILSLSLFFVVVVSFVTAIILGKFENYLDIYVLPITLLMSVLIGIDIILLAFSDYVSKKVVNPNSKEIGGKK